jgi:uncharacterized membrane protein
MRGNVDLQRAFGAAVLCALIAVLVPVVGVSLAAALPLCLYLPGYAITSAAFASRGLPRPELHLLSVGLSLATLALGVLVLNIFPWGVRDFSWAILLVIVVGAGCRLAALRRRVRRSAAPLRLPGRVPRLDAVLVILALLAAAAALVIAQTPVSNGRAIGYSSLWMLPRTAGAVPKAEIGVTSNEQSRTGYRLEVRLASGRLLRAARFSLDPAETKLLRVAVPEEGGTAPSELVASLYHSREADRLYRQVTASLPGEAAAR